MTETLLAAPETHDRITEAYLGRMGKTFMHATRKRIHWICAEARGRRVLDIGCSQGITAILLARDGFEVTGVDLDPQAIAEARDWLVAEPEAVQGRVRLVEADAAALPVEAPYDTVILGEILEHLDDPAALVAAAARHLAPGGRLVVTVPFGIHDYPDHRQTFYLAAPHRLLTAHVAIDAVEIIDRWIGIAGNRPEDGAAPEPAAIGDVRLDLLEAGFQALERRLRDAIGKLRDRTRTAEGRISTLDTEIAVLQRTCAAAEARAAEQAAALEAARRALAEHERALARSIERHSRATRINASLARQLQDIEQSESFRLGHGIVRLFAVPHRLWHGKSAFSRASREAEAVLPAAPEDAGPQISLPDLIALHDSEGPGAIVAALRDKTGGDRTRLSHAIVRAARTLVQAGLVEAEYPLVSEAVRVERSEASLRAFYWAAQRGGELRAAWSTLAEIERLYGEDPTPAQRKYLEKLRSGHIVNLGLLDEIDPAAPRALEPVPNRLCYVLHNTLPYSSGGYATRTHGMARGLTTAGFEVVCLSRPGFPLDTKPELTRAAVPPEDVIDGIRYLREYAPLREKISLPNYIREATDVMEAQFRVLRPEVVMAASAYLSALPALIAAKRLGLPFVYEVRGFWEITRMSRNPDTVHTAFFKVQKVLEAEIAHHADHVFTLTEPMREELLARGVETPITLLPNSCDPVRFTPRPRDADLAARLGIPPDVPVIGYIGTFVQYEGLEHLAEACARLAAEGRDFRLLLVGNEDTSGTGRGPITTEILATAVETGLASRLIMPGRVPHDEVEAYYSLIDIAPFPRKPQPVTEMVSPMKPLEALAMEKAVVVSSVRALTEMIRHEETGLVFEKGSIESLAATLARLIDDPGLRARLGRTARDWVVRERTWDATAGMAAAELNRLRIPVPETPRDPARGSSPATQSVTAAEAETPADPFDEVRVLFRARERALGKVLFSEADWARTRLACDILDGVAEIADIGIGQGQLVNVLARSPGVRRVHGYDFRKHSKLIEPDTPAYSFRAWDITGTPSFTPPPVDVVVAMEVLEHIAVDALPGAIARLRAMARHGALLVTVPYREKAPLYHHDKPHGHKQSFDDAKIERLFGPRCRYANFRDRWYVAFCHDRLVGAAPSALEEFAGIARGAMGFAARRTPA